MDAEKEKRKREEEHHRTAKSFADLELQVQMNEKLYPKSIEKARYVFTQPLYTSQLSPRPVAEEPVDPTIYR